MRKLGLILGILLWTSSAFATTVSFDQLATSADLTTTKYNTDLERIFNKANTAIDGNNVTADSLLEANMADEINPRIRTYENFGEYVESGMLTTTTSGTLVGSVPAGTAYPRGYRVRKDSSTAKTFTASKWTFVDVDINSDFQYSEVAIEGATPSIATNSVRLSRVSTDGTQIVAVQDLRILNPVAAFKNTVDGAGESTLEDLLITGSPGKGGDSVGWIQGCQISWDAETTFKVRRGSIWINGHYRNVSSDVSVPQTNDAPASGTSGLDTGSIAASTSYDVYAVADQDNLKTFSITYSTNAVSPTGCTNFRKIGHVRTDNGSKFTSADLYSSHIWSQREIVTAWADIASTALIYDSHNVAAVISKTGGIYIVCFDLNFNNDKYAIGGAAVAGYILGWTADNKNLGDMRVDVVGNNGVGTDTSFDLIVVGARSQ